MKVRVVAVAAAMLLVWTLSSARGEDSNGFFGLAIAIDVEGFFLNPILRTLTIEKVEPSSPAAHAGIAPGDQILEMEGRVIAGRPRKVR